MAEMSDEEARRIKRERCAAQIERHMRVGRKVLPVVVFSAGPEHQPRCAAAARLDRKHLEDPPMLPLDACDQPRCYCSWRGVSNWELRKREGG